jgi:plastocyanin
MPRLPSVASAALVSAVLLVAACGGSDSVEVGAQADEASTATTLDLSATEFTFAPSDATVDTAGDVTIRVTNDGGAVHALEIEGNGTEAETAEIEPGGSAELTVELSEGTYTIYCPIGDHRSRGMEGAITVGGAAPAPGGEPDDSGSDRSDGYGSY